MLERRTPILLIRHLLDAQLSFQKYCEGQSNNRTTTRRGGEGGFEPAINITAIVRNEPQLYFGDARSRRGELIVTEIKCYGLSQTF